MPTSTRAWSTKALSASNRGPSKAITLTPEFVRFPEGAA
jgi:hypothetical protein